ncbi:uncharacterized protein LOC112084126 [Eutrema salsugineum]|uniref:uncharacterized protein LOC112084126 n=1 Tax=Eutrema salsugineum TaxID=72664 RepID=UPI000CED6C04|nr:uncharacterized protein LOC112084126 [Eutrema salsugineum]
MTSSSEKIFPLSAKDYELFEEIRDGVYRARCILLDEIVAVKILDRENCRSDVETISKEVHTMSLTDHRNLLRPHCYFFDGNSFWIVMPYLQDVQAGNILADSNETVSLGDFALSASQLLAALREQIGIPSGAESSIGEEETLERNLASDNSDKLINYEALTAWIQNPLSSNAAQILPSLQNLLHENQMQRERLIGLNQLYDPTAVNRNPMVNREGVQISAETDLSSEVHFLEQRVKELEEEVENLKKANAQLEDQINRLTNDEEQ